MRRIPNEKAVYYRCLRLFSRISGHSRHGVIVLERTEDYILTTESGTNQKVYWGAQYFRWWLEDQPTYVLYTRYPA